MNTEEAWRAWWDAEGKHMERLPHHNAIDHMASVTRIAWLNGAFEASDQIERLREERDKANRHADQYAQRNAVLVVEIDKVRQELKEAKARNTLYLSRLQEHEAREQ